MATYVLGWSRLTCTRTIMHWLAPFRLLKTSLCRTMMHHSKLLCTSNTRSSHNSDEHYKSILSYLAFMERSPSKDVSVVIPTKRMPRLATESFYFLSRWRHGVIELGARTACEGYSPSLFGVGSCCFDTAFECWKPSDLI